MIGLAPWDLDCMQSTHLSAFAERATDRGEVARDEPLVDPAREMPWVRCGAQAPRIYETALQLTG